MKKVKLNESQLNNIILESTKNVLNEWFGISAAQNAMDASKAKELYGMVCRWGNEHKMSRDDWQAFTNLINDSMANF